MHQWASHSSQNQPNLSLKQAIMLKILPKKQTQNKESKQSANSCENEVFGCKKTELQLLQFILSYQLQEHRGYLSYGEWIEINKKLWGDHIIKTSQQFWKIIRLINEGQVVIPTGLIYEVIKCLLSTPNEKKIKLILQQFLRKNGKKDGLSSYRQLRNYPTLSQIISGYVNKANNDSKFGLKQQINSTNTFVNRLSHNEKKKQSFLNHLRYQSLVDQMRDCSFKPEISQFASQLKKEKPKQKQKHLKCLQEQAKEKQLHQIFKAKPIDQRVYKGSLKSIPGKKVLLGVAAKVETLSRKVSGKLSVNIPNVMHVVKKAV